MWPHVCIICVCLVFLSVGDLLGMWPHVYTICVCLVFLSVGDLLGVWPHVYVICVCLVFLSVGDLLVNKKLPFVFYTFLYILNYHLETRNAFCDLLSENT